MHRNWLWTFAVVLVLSPAPLIRAAPGAELEAALEVAKWLRSVGRDSDHGRVWPADPEKPEEVVTHLYSGTSGVTLFFLEAHAMTGEAAFLQEAREGADYLLRTLPEQVKGEETGLYTGIAGVGFTLAETYRATAEEKYLVGARRTVELLKESARVRNDGVTWSDTTDIISGSAGIGLFLLRMNEPQAKEVAVRAGRHLLAQGREEEQGMKWPMSPTYPRLMPNFSHGTAGVAFFLARLHEEAGDEGFLRAAVSGAEYLRSIARIVNRACLIFHHEPGGEDLFYLGWCHGPAGTARLFYQLWKVTGKEMWMEWAEKAAHAILQSGIPEVKTPGFWNNHGLCCGTAGVADFMLSLHRATGRAEYLAFAKRATAHLLEHATRDERGMRWIDAEHRVQPELVKAQTGYMQGAAGIGMWLLRLHAFEQGKAGTVKLPDSPF